MLVVKETTYFFNESKLLILLIDIVYAAIIRKPDGFFYAPGIQYELCTAEWSFVS